MLAARAEPRRPYGASATAPSTDSVIQSRAPVACVPSRAGAAQPSTATAAATAATAPISRRPTRSPSTRAPIASRKTRLVATAGCTSVSGAHVSASACSAQPARPTAVPASQRGLATSRRKSDTRSACSSGASRASRACSAIPAAYSAAAPNAHARPIRSRAIAVASR
jgi:hypothetical protein